MPDSPADPSNTMALSPEARAEYAPYASFSVFVFSNCFGELSSRFVCQSTNTRILSGCAH